ncbi:MAG TPA: universal stress protein [Armatimonadota bacterium]|jgi:nucleotide-binding universal stress UspA family protein
MVGSTPSETSSTSLRYRNIVVPLDGSILAEQALGPAEAMARAFDATLTLIHATLPIETVVRQLTPVDITVACDPQEMVGIEAEQCKRYLEGIAARLEDRGIRAVTVQREGHAADVIRAVARELPADLITITTHGRGGWRRLIFGSVAEEVIRHACCPVLVIHVAQ